MKKQDRIVVCPKCGSLYDLHYIDKVKVRKGFIEKFECNNCGMVNAVYKNLEHFKKREIKGYCCECGGEVKGNSHKCETLKDIDKQHKSLLIIYKDNTKLLPVEVWVDNNLVWGGGSYQIKYSQKNKQK